MNYDFRGIFYLAAFGLFVGVPLAIWKCAEAVVWLCSHLRWQ